jgi:hypothetical protein
MKHAILARAFQRILGSSMPACGPARAVGCGAASTCLIRLYLWRNGRRSSEWLRVDPVSVAVFGCALLVALGTDACGGKIVSTEGQAESDDASDEGLADGCGALDLTLTCGADACGNAISAICLGDLWVCPLIPASGCSTDASALDGASGTTGFACGSGSCPPDTFCQNPFGTSLGLCIPLPPECKLTPYVPSATCACLERRAARAGVCRSNHFVCPYPAGDFNRLHVGCVAD